MSITKDEIRKFRVVVTEKQKSQSLEAKCVSQKERLKIVEDTVERLWTIPCDELNFSIILGTGGWGYVTELVMVII